jgi:hypothetical protein
LANSKFKAILKENFITVTKETGQYIDDKYAVAYYEGFDELEKKPVFIKNHDKEVNGVTKTFISIRYSENNDDWNIIGSYISEPNI